MHVDWKVYQRYRGCSKDGIEVKMNTILQKHVIKREY